MKPTHPRTNRGQACPATALLRLWLLALVLGSSALLGKQAPRGLPFIRTYPLDEIGKVSKSLRLGFDSFGRVAVMYDGVYTVLNDSAWVDRIDHRAAARLKMHTLRLMKGTYYYGGRGTWGLVTTTAEGHFTASPLVPADAPTWTSVTPFNKLLGTAQGMFFWEINGCVFWDFAEQRNHFFAMPRLSSLFQVGDQVFASCQDRQLRELLLPEKKFVEKSGTGLDGEIVKFAAPLDPGHTLLALVSGRLVTFDGRQVAPWGEDLAGSGAAEITAMESLPEGGVAIAIAKKGVYLCKPDGQFVWALELPDFHTITSMAANEEGVLWIAGNNAVHRIFYDSPLTTCGQHLGLSVYWPQIECWEGKTMISSNGTLYEAVSTKAGHPSPFRQVGVLPENKVDYVASSGSLLLTGNQEGVYSVSREHTFKQEISIANVAGLRFIDATTCLVIGSKEIAALRYEEGRWKECATRIPGVGDAPIHLVQHKTLWFELGGNQVGRLTLSNNKLNLEVLQVPWDNEQWVNLGVIGDMIILSGSNRHRTYYDEVKGGFCDNPTLDRLLAQSPFWIMRVTVDDTGVLWATHDQGVVTFKPTPNGYDIDAVTFELRNDAYPYVTLTPDGNKWVAAGRSLYHVEEDTISKRKPVRTHLVSLYSDLQNRELLPRNGMDKLPYRFPSEDNSLGFRFFSGTYAWRFPPIYEYRLGQADKWTELDPSQQVRLPRLKEGIYLLQVRQAGQQYTATPPLTLGFLISPPWYRSPVLYFVYPILLLFSILGIARWINHRSLKRNAELESLVAQRTQELELTMHKLGEETRHAATLAERSRLAAEIHDSLQQSISGAILLLETTLGYETMRDEVHAKLSLVKSMISYSREEVQHAVWNLGSPLLQNATLGDAIKQLSRYINYGPIDLQVQVSEEPRALDYTTQHNLLRITQEAITNAVKHAQAKVILISLRGDAKAVQLEITDDGRGFDPSSASMMEGHFGLRGIRSRADTIHAELSITSKPGSGTTIQVKVPLHCSSDHGHLL